MSYQSESFHWLHCALVHTLHSEVFCSFSSSDPFTTMLPTHTEASLYELEIAWDCGSQVVSSSQRRQCFCPQGCSAAPILNWQQTEFFRHRRASDLVRFRQNRWGYLATFCPIDFIRFEWFFSMGAKVAIHSQVPGYPAIPTGWTSTTLSSWFIKDLQKTVSDPILFNVFPKIRDDKTERARSDLQMMWMWKPLQTYQRTRLKFKVIFLIEIKMDEFQ